MKISTIKLLVIELILTLFLFLNIFVVKAKSIYILSFILLLFLGITIFALGYEKNRQRFKKDIILSVIIYTFSFQIILYLGGLFLGFIKNPYSLTFLNIIRNVSPVLILIITSEILRYSINIKAQKQKYLLILSTLIFVLIDVSLQIHLYHLNDKKEVFELLSYIVLPSISKNILLTYFSVKFGYGCNILYRIIMELSLYFIPIFPDFNIYLNSVVYFVFPLVLLYINRKGFQLKKETIDTRKKHKYRNIMSGVVIIFFVIVVGLTSGIFSYYSLVIGSGSMTPTINKGDVVIVQKVSSNKMASLSEGDVLVFQYDKKVVVHRIAEIHKVGENYTFKTKGDNNERIDEWIIDEKKVIGKVVLRVPLIGYPTVWLNEVVK